MASTVRRLSWQDHAGVGEMVRAALELGLARLRLSSRHARALNAAPPPAVAELDDRQAALVDRVAYIIPRLAARLPWRADCLVQALAARRWLKREGIASHLHLGVPINTADVFEAHAWLTVSGRIVTGGDIGGYNPLRHHLDRPRR